MRFVDDETDHAKLQLARLAQAMQIASVAVSDGNMKAIPALLKVMDRIDRYQRAAKVSEVYDDEARKRLMDKINRVAANLGQGRADDGDRGAGSGPDSGEAAGEPDEKEKMAITPKQGVSLMSNSFAENDCGRAIFRDVGWGNIESRYG